MHRTMNKIFPREASNHYQGYRIAAWVFLLIASVEFVRSLIHIFAPDGGAGSIAGMDVSVPGGKGIIFALWGSAQLLEALISLVVFFRYKTLIPFMYLYIIAEYLLRIFVGHMKPVSFAHTPPGQIADYAMIPLALIMLVLALLNRPGIKEMHD